MDLIFSPPPRPCTCIATGARFWVECLSCDIPDFLREDADVQGPCADCEDTGFVEVACKYCNGTGLVLPWLERRR